MANKKKKASSYNYQNQPQAGSLLESLATPMEYIMRAFVLAIFVGIPLTFTDNATLVMAKQRTFFLMVILLGVAVLFTVAFLLSQGNKLKVNWKAFFKGVRPHEYALFAYWVVLLLSAAFSPFGQMGWVGGSTRPQNFLTLSCYILVFFLVSRFYKPSIKDLMVFCGIAALVGAYGICQFYKFDFFKMIQNPWEWGNSLYLITTMSNVNVASTYFTLAFCIAYSCFIRKVKWHWAFLGLALLLFYVLLITDTESGYVGVLLSGALCFSLLIRNREDAGRFILLLACCCLMMWVFNMAYSYLYTGQQALEDRWQLAGQTRNTGSLHTILLPAAAVFGALAAGVLFTKIRKPEKLKRKTWHIAWFAALLVMLLVAAAALPSLAAYTGINSLYELNEILHGNMSDQFMNNRAYVWKNSVKLIPKRPLIGYGPDCFVEAYNREFYQQTYDLQRVWYDKPHNEYLQTLVETGVLGLLSLLAFFGLLFWAGRKRCSDTLSLALGIAMICFLIQAFFNFATPVSHSIVWTMCGVLGAVMCYGETEGR